MPLRLEITLPPQIALDLDPRLVRAVLRSAGSEIAAVARRKIRQTTGGGHVYLRPRQGPPSCLAAGTAASKLDGVSMCVASRRAGPLIGCAACWASAVR
jgi:hypothetical protein